MAPPPIPDLESVPTAPVMRDKICTRCGYVGKPYRSEPGVVEILLVFLLLFFFLIPGIIYIVVLARGQRLCPKCKTAAMIPTDTPLAQKLVKEIGQAAAITPEGPRFKTKAEYEAWRSAQNAPSGKESPTQDRP